MSVRATNRITPFRDVLFSSESAAVLYEIGRTDLFAPTGSSLKVNR